MNFPRRYKTTFMWTFSVSAYILRSLFPSCLKKQWIASPEVDCQPDIEISHNFPISSPDDQPVILGVRKKGPL